MTIKNGLIIDKNRMKKWYQYGKRHRDNGLPAIISSNGDVEYWENDEQLTKEESEYRQQMRVLNKDLQNNLTTSTTVNKPSKI